MYGISEFSTWIEGATGKAVDIFMAEVEGGFLGVSLTERDGLSMRRIAAEMHDLSEIKKLRDSLNAFIRKTEGTQSNAVEALIGKTITGAGIAQLVDGEEVRMQFTDGSSVTIGGSQREGYPMEMLVDVSASR